MKFSVFLFCCPAIVLGLASCAAKTPKSSPMQEQPPPASATPIKEDHAEHTPLDATSTDAPPAAQATPVLSEELTAFAKAKPVFEKYCARCHTESAGKRTALKHFAMDAYPFGGHHASSMPGTIRNVLGQSGKRATMPKDKPGAVSGDELKLILDWADAVDRASASKPTPTDRHAHQH